ncbi:hypothetical protein CU098_001883, partial [Rhizopus stolonifer]
MLPRSEVLDGLKVSLSPFGQVIDVGTITEPNTGFFMGAGYAVVGVPRHSVEGQSSYQTLTHTTPWCEDKDEIIHATWNNMPTWCRYCHQTGHAKFECAKSKAKIICYNCHLLGHWSFECPRKAPISPSKKRKTSAVKKQSVEEMSQSALKEVQKASSAEALKSKHAPSDVRAILTIFFEFNTFCAKIIDIMLRFNINLEILSWSI